MAFVEEVFKRRAQQVHDHDVVVVLGPEVVHRAETVAIRELAVHFVLVSQLGTPGPLPLKLDGDLEEKQFTKNKQQRQSLI